MTEAPKLGLLHVLGQVCEIMASEGVCYEVAQERLQQKQRDELEEFADTNIVSLEAFRKRKLN
jgi:hypothetical protein